MINVKEVEQRRNLEVSEKEIDRNSEENATM